MDLGTLVETAGTPVAQTGVQFIWAISFGQLVTFGLTAVAFIFGAGKLYTSVYQTKKNTDKLAADMAQFEKSLKRVEERHEESLAQCRDEHREQMLQMRGSLDNLHQAMYSAIGIRHAPHRLDFRGVHPGGALPEQHPSDNDHWEDGER